MGDEELAQRVYDAYDAFSPSEDVQGRVLDALRAHEHEGALASHGQNRRGSRVWWLLALPAAACLALIALVNVGPQRSEAPAQMDAVAKTEERVTMSMEDVESYMEPSLAQEYPIVALAQGPTLKVGDVALDFVDEGDAVQATASTEGGMQEIPCWVVGGADGYHVRYEEEGVWYEAMPVDD